MTIQPIIEVYYDRSGIIGGKSGCYRAYLQDARGCHSAGKNADKAIDELLRTIASFAKPSDTFPYQKYAALPTSREGYQVIHEKAK